MVEQVVAAKSIIEKLKARRLLSQENCAKKATPRDEVKGKGKNNNEFW